MGFLKTTNISTYSFEAGGSHRRDVARKSTPRIQIDPVITLKKHHHQLGNIWAASAQNAARRG